MLVQLDKEIEVAMLEYTSAKERLTLASVLIVNDSNKPSMVNQP